MVLLWSSGVVVTQHPSTCSCPTTPATSTTQDMAMSTSGSYTIPAVLGGIIVVLVMIIVVLVVIVIVLIVLLR